MLDPWVEVRKIRSMGYEERMMPVQVREVIFRMPESNVELAAIRLDLRQEEKKLMRVEQITPRGHPMELEEIMVSVVAGAVCIKYDLISRAPLVTRRGIDRPAGNELNFWI